MENHDRVATRLICHDVDIATVAISQSHFSRHHHQSHDSRCPEKTE